MTNQQPTPKRPHGGIAWCDWTSNPIKYRDADGRAVWGCSKVSAGCTHCYAEALAHRYKKGGPFNDAEMAKLTPFVDPTEMRRLRTSKLISGKRVFVGDMTDIFGAWVPDALIDRIFVVMAARQDVTFQLLTKRPERLRDYVLRANDQPLPVLPLPNVWLGTTVENQETADTRIRHLLETPAAIRFVSYEPAIGPVKFNAIRWESPVGNFGGGAYLDVLKGTFCTIGGHGMPCGRLDWVIFGGESGSKARPFEAVWARALVQQCRAAGVACFVKQLGANVRDRNDAGFMGATVTSWPDFIDEEDRIEHDLDGTRDGYQGAPVRVHLRSRSGGDPTEWPRDIRVREWPQAAVR